MDAIPFVEEVQGNFEGIRKRLRFDINGPSSSDTSGSQAVMETTTNVIPFANFDWTNNIEVDMAVFIVEPNEEYLRTYDQVRPRLDSKYMFTLANTNVILHQASLVYTLHKNDNTGQKRLPEVEDLKCSCSFRGINRTAKSEGMHAPNMSIERDVVAWSRGPTYVFNYWGNVCGGTYLYFVMKKVKINSLTEFRLGTSEIIHEQNIVKNDSTGEPETEYILPDNKMNGAAPKKRRMAIQIVPMVPGCPTGDKTMRVQSDDLTYQRRNLSTEELSFVDWDDPIDPKHADSNDPKYFRKKLGHAVLAGICYENPSYTANSPDNYQSVLSSMRDTVYTGNKKKLWIYASTYTF